MQLKDDKRQKNQLQQWLAFPETGRSEALESSRRGTESTLAKHKSESPASSDQFMEEICQAENCKQALARVKSNKGSPGVDGMTVEKLPDCLKQHWPKVREQLLSGTYPPQPVKRVEIPKRDGGMRKLSIPSALDDQRQAWVETDSTLSSGRSDGERAGESGG